MSPGVIVLVHGPDEFLLERSDQVSKGAPSDDVAGGLENGNARNQHKNTRTPRDLRSEWCGCVPTGHSAFPAFCYAYTGDAMADAADSLALDMLSDSPRCVKMYEYGISVIT